MTDHLCPICGRPLHTGEHYVTCSEEWTCDFSLSANNQTELQEQLSKLAEIRVNNHPTCYTCKKNSTDGMGLVTCLRSEGPYFYCPEHTALQEQNNAK